MGETSMELCKHTSCPVYGIDPIVYDSMDPTLIGNVDTIRNGAAAFKHFRFIQDYSYNVAKTWDRKIDMLFIDGDHRYEAVKKDYTDWAGFVTSQGVIAFHDSACFRGGPPFWEGPSRFVDELINQQEGQSLKYVETVDSLTIFKKEI